MQILRSMVHTSLMRASHLLVPAVLILTGATACLSRVKRTPTPPAPLRCSTNRLHDCQRVAEQIFAAEMARTGRICVGATTQRDENACIRYATDTTDRNLASFVDALETIVGRPAVRDSEKAWLEYRSTQCQAVFDLFRPGTMAGAAQVRCEMRLARSRMRDLNELFETSLHH